jgi:hypothetical protein
MYKDIMMGFDFYLLMWQLDYQGNNLVYLIFFTLVDETVKIK